MIRKGWVHDFDPPYPWFAKAWWFGKNMLHHKIFEALAANAFKMNRVMGKSNVGYC